MATVMIFRNPDLVRIGVIFFVASLFSPWTYAQQQAPSTVQVRVDGPSQRLEMVVNTSRILTLDKDVPRVLVNNPDVVRAVPVSPNQIQVWALKTGATSVNLVDSEGSVRPVDVIVYGDGRQLQMLLRSQFPHAAIQVRPLVSSVVLSGHVDRREIITPIVKMAEEYYPKVINNISVGGVHQVALHVKVMEVSRTKLRNLGVDWASTNGEDFIFTSISEIITGFVPGARPFTTGNETVSVGLINDNDQFFAFLEAIRQNNLVKVLAEPTVTTVSGRAASFNAGGEFPIIVPQSLGTVAIEFKQFGTRVDFMPIVYGNGDIRLEVRPQISEIDEARGVEINGFLVPGLRTRWVDTATELKAGQTLALAGLLQTRIEAENRGIPLLADMPWVGAAFRRVREEINEIELLVLVRPELVDGMDPHEVPGPGPGEHTTSPCNTDLYMRGYLEVPACGDPTGCGEGGTGRFYQEQPQAETLPSAQNDADSSMPAPIVIPSSVQPSSYQTTHRGQIGNPSLTPIRSRGLAPVHGLPQNQRHIIRHNPSSRIAQRPLATVKHLKRNSRDAAPPVSPGMLGPKGYDNLDY